MTYIYKAKPYDHQHRDFELSRDMEIFAFLYEMGAGKSKPNVDTAAYLYSKGRINCFVILAPNGVHSKWLREDIPLSMPDYIEYRAAVWEAGNKKSMQACEDLLLPGDHLRILCANIEGMSYASLPKFLKRLLLATDSMLIVDESTRIKEPKSIRTKNLMELVRYTKYRRILAGDAVVNNPFDLFSQFAFLDPDILGHSFPAFKNEYAEILPKNHPMVQAIVKKRNLRFAPQLVATDELGNPRYRNLERLKAKIAPYSSRVLKSECTDLPPKIYEKRFFKLTPEQRRIYAEITENGRFKFDDQTVSIMEKLTISMRLQQLTCGVVVDSQKNHIRLFENPQDNPRIQLLMETLEDVEGQVLIWARFKQDIKDIASVLGEDCVTYYGEDDTDDRKLALQRFANGEVKYFVGTPQAGGIGLNLTTSATAIYYSNSLKAGDRWQSEDRCHRIGQTADKVLYIDLVAEGTVDETILSALADKKDLSDYLLSLKAHHAALV